MIDSQKLDGVVPKMTTFVVLLLPPSSSRAQFVETHFLLVSKSIVDGKNLPQQIHGEIGRNWKKNS